MLYIHVLILFIYLFIYFSFLVITSSTAEPLGFSLTGALLGGAIVPGVMAGLQY